MAVDEHAPTIEHQGLRFAFCSDQCQERFQANPHLYIGRPGHPAPAQQGHRVIKERTLELDRPLTAEQAAALTAALREMMGIHEVEAGGTCVRIRYDLLQATTEQIENRIAAIGENLKQGLGASLRRAFIHYLEETELANLEATGGGHHHH